MSWDDKKIKTLENMWGNGSTALEIAKKIGKTRSSVLSKIRRLKLTRRLDPDHQKQPKPIGGATPHNANRKQRKIYAPTKLRIELSSTAYGKKCGLMELQRSQCCWPIGNPAHDDFGFCAADKEKPEDNYCEKHKSIAYS